jgi:hypothetical protein
VESITSFVTELVRQSPTAVAEAMRGHVVQTRFSKELPFLRYSWQVSLPCFERKKTKGASSPWL